MMVYREALLQFDTIPFIFPLRQNSSFVSYSAGLVVGGWPCDPLASPRAISISDVIVVARFPASTRDPQKFC